MSRVPYIDSWRFVAVALVVLAHHHYQSSDTSVPAPATAYFYWGQVGVYIFFFLSGFVVSRACLDEVRRTGGFSVAGFYTRRSFRIVPPLMLYLGTCAVLGFLGLIDVTGLDLLFASTYVCNVGLVDCGWWVAHTWSLAYEEQFYLLFALLFVWRYTRSRPHPVLLVAVTVFALLPMLSPRGPSGLSGLPVVYALFFGGYLFARHEDAWLRMPLPLLGFLLGAAVTFTPPLYLLDEEHHRFYKLLYVWSIPLMVVSSGSALFILKRLFEFRLIRYLGVISYSIYLWQQLVSGLIAGSAPALQILAWVGMVIACAVLFEFFERPLVGFSRRIAPGVRVAL